MLIVGKRRVEARWQVARPEEAMEAFIAADARGPALEKRGSVMQDWTDVISITR